MMKKLVALLMALALLCTSIGAFATEPEAPVHVHNYQFDCWYLNQPPTCEAGTKAWMVCTGTEGTCDEPSILRDYDPIDHTPADDWVETTAPGLATAGEETLYCTVCNNPIETRAIDPIFDTTVANIEDYDVSGQPGDIPAGIGNVDAEGHAVHTKGYPAKSNTANPGQCKDWVRKYYCVECRSVITVTIAATANHTASQADLASGITTYVVTAATCTTDGFITYKGRCSVCEKENLEWKVTTDPATNHKAADEASIVDTPATCFAPRTKTYTCVNPNCPVPDRKIVEVIGEKLEHEWVSDSYVDVATCTKPGSYGTGMVCKNCGTADKANQDTNVTVDMLKHQDLLDEAVEDDENNDFWKKEDGKFVLNMDLEAGETVQDEEDVETVEVILTGVGEADTVLTVGEYGQLKYVYTAPTCTEKGHITVTCIECGATVEHDLDALGHIYFDFEEPWRDEPYDCTKEYSRLVECVRPGCDYTFNMTIPTFAKHNFDDVVGYAQKLPTGALVKYYVWDYEDDLELAFDNIAECADYYKIMRCSNGGEMYIGQGWNEDDQEEFEIYAHAFCEIEELVLVEGDGKHKVNQAKPHTKEDATCTEPGVIAYECENCKFRKVETIPAKNHNMVDGKVTVAATCTTPGTREIYCSACGSVNETTGRVIQSIAGETGVQTKTVPVIDHIFAIHNEPADCLNNKQGVYYEYCTMCNLKQNEVITSGHEIDESLYHAVHIEPKCTSVGYQTFTCKNCHKTFVNQEMPALGHSYQREMGANGVKKVLSIDEVKENHLDAEGDECTTACKAATCTKNAKHVLTCEDCTAGNLTWYEEGTATGEHTYMDGNALTDTFTIVEFPTCDAAGYALYTCKTCETQQRYDLPKLPHNLDVDYDHDKEVFFFHCQPLRNDANGAAQLGRLIDQVIDDELIAAELVEQILAATPAYAEIGTFGQDEHVIEIPALKTEFTVSKANGLGKITLKDEKMGLYSVPYVRVTWCYTLGNGDTVAFTACREAKWVADGVYTFKLTGLRVPSDAVLDDIWAEVVMDPDADDMFVGQYETYGEGSVK